MENLKVLLKKYITNEINKAERDLLKSELAQVSDTVLQHALSEFWNEYTFDSAPYGDFAELVRWLQIVPEKRAHYFMRTVLKVAAVLIISLLVTLSVYFYLDNRQLTAFVERQLFVHVKSGEKAEITLPDGSMVFLNAATSLYYASDYGKEERAVEISGEAYLKVVRNEEMPFFLNTDCVRIEVLGTEFNVSSYSDLDVVEATLVSGSVALTTMGIQPQRVVLLSGEKAVYHKQSDRLTVATVDLHFETAWLRGELIFRSAKFSDIMYKLQQRYGVTIEIVGEKYDDALFTGSFKEEYIHGVLKNLQLHYDFTYTVDADDKIKIRFRRPLSNVSNI
jgi:ferric-dicitrate binding protein FerR (iron transport regulator)